MTQTKLAAGLVQPAGGSLQDLVDSDGNRLARWRLTLDSAWRRKMDEVIALSKVCCGLTLNDDGNPASPGAWVSSRLEARTERAYDQLVAIEDAIARIDDGTYGMCASCRQSMPDEWLADNPAVLYCPDCYLRRTSRQDRQSGRDIHDDDDSRDFRKEHDCVQRA